MSKKWYSYFVSVDPASGEADAGAAKNEPSSSGPDAARTVADIAASLSPPPLFQQGVTGVTDPTSFEQIYAAAEILVPAHGFTIFKIGDMLKSEHIRTLPVDIKRSSVLLALDAAGVKVQEVIEDAVKRDRALDTFEAVQQRALDQLQASKSEDNQKLQQEADRVLNELRARIQSNNDEVAKERENLQTWRLQKHKEEQRIAEAVRPFVSENPITTSTPQAPTDSSKKPGEPGQPRP